MWEKGVGRECGKSEQGCGLGRGQRIRERRAGVVKVWKVDVSEGKGSVSVVLARGGGGRGV